ncbi:nucleotidyltransferase family protein [Mesorhizobium sp. 10J20-29]
MIFKDYGAIFLHPGKTAGTAIEGYFAPEGRDPLVADRSCAFGFDPGLGIFLQHATLAVVRDLAGNETWERSFKFAIVRNPYARMVSVFNYGLKSHLARFGSFDGFVRALPALSRSPASRLGNHLSPQILYTHDRQRQAIDYVGRFEALDLALSDVGQHLRLADPIRLRPPPAKSPQPGKAAIGSLDPELAAIILDTYREDFEAFGYDTALPVIEQNASRTLSAGGFAAESDPVRRRGLPGLAGRNADNWLLWAADPLADQRSPPAVALDAGSAAGLLAQAELHGVLPAVVGNLAILDGDPALRTLLDEAGAGLRAARALVLMLRSELSAIEAATEGLPFTAIKGPVFSAAIYPSRALRSYSDIDLLAAPDALAPLGTLLAGRGYRLADEAGARLRGEWVWVHAENPLLMVEVHSDLVHSPGLKSGFSFTYDDLTQDSRTPAGCLLVACVHGAYHYFERLQHVVDICQAARALSSSDEARFQALAQAPGARFAAITGLNLAGRLFAEPRCFEIAAALRPVRGTRRAGWLIGRRTVLTSRTEARSVHSWRRQAYRQLLKHRG